MAALCLACSMCGLVMVPNKKRKIAALKNDADEENNKSASHCGLFTNTSFLLIMLGNMPFVMAIYTSYTYLPAVSSNPSPSILSPSS